MSGNGSVSIDRVEAQAVKISSEHKQQTGISPKEAQETLIEHIRKGNGQLVSGALKLFYTSKDMKEFKATFDLVRDCIETLKEDGIDGFLERRGQ